MNGAFAATQIAVLIATAEKRLLDQLRAADAYSPDRAVALERSSELEEGHLRTLLKEGVVRRTDAELYYLDEQALANRRNTPVGAVWIVVGAAILVAGLLWLVLR